MRRAIRVLSPGSWPLKVEKTTATLDFDLRHRRRIKLEDDQGEAFLLDLPEVTRMIDGEGLAFEDGSVLRVIAAPEDVADITCGGIGHLARIAWHLGNRHLPVQVVDDHTLRIAWDHVIADMAAQLGAAVERRHIPFQPEAGAYDGPGASTHDHGHGHSHEPGHDHDHAHKHGHDHGHG